MTNQNSAAQAAMQELKPCPFCGGPAEIYNPFHMIGKPSQPATYRGGVRCRACGCESKATTPPDGAITTWNRRADAAPQASAEKDAAVRTLTAKGYTWHGGEQWKPPLGDSNATLARLDASDALEVARAALMEIADLADVEADQRSVIVNQALTKIAKMTAGPQADKDGAVDESRNLQGNPVDRSAELQGDKDGGQQRAGDVDERAVLDVVRAALPEFRQQDDYLLAHGASLMSENSHEIIHIDTLRRVISAALSAPQAEQGERDE
ncbi:Lar family restriction alleviation protein [Achromobacter dolens]|uniref:Lar family restriction alleviation protein n=1 Tax=Achromobacter dolens TaxID=1287738 RepID=UPI003B9B5BF3